MLPRHITHHSILVVLTAGLSLVILLLAAATIVGVRGIQSIRESASSLVREQAVTNHLIDELHNQQTNLSEVFSVLARDPDSVDADRIFIQLDTAERDIDRISTEGERTAEGHLWIRLRQTSLQFSGEARRLLTEEVETYASSDLFRRHEAFVSVVARLIEAEYRKVSAAQAQIDRYSSHLLRNSQGIGSGAALLAILFAILTVGLIRRLTVTMELQADELSRVSWQMLANQEAAARRFSHELHDELGQSLTAVKTGLAVLDVNGELNHDRIADCVRLVDEAIGNVRQLSQLLRPTILDDFGLEAGLRWLCEGFAARTGIGVDLKSSYEGRLPDETETHLFRIAQEALTNIARHSGARCVHVTLERVRDQIVLQVQDDGRGLKGPPAAGSLGLIGMRARARSTGGEVDIRSRPGEGVTIEVRVPVGHEAHSNSVG